MALYLSLADFNQIICLAIFRFLLYLIVGNIIILIFAFLQSRIYSFFLLICKCIPKILCFFLFG